MILSLSANKRSIESFSGIKNRKLARTLVRSMQELAAQSGEFAVYGLPILKLNPTEQDLDCPMLRAAYRYWQDHRREDEPPPTSRIDPAALRPALGWFTLVEPIDQGDDFVYRLFGSEIAWRFDLDLTGRRVSSLPQPFAQFSLATYRACVAARGPLLAQCALGDLLVDQIRCLLLPWANDSGAIARVMAVVSVRDRRGEGGPPPHSHLVRNKA